MNISIIESLVSSQYQISTTTHDISTSNSFRDPCKYVYALDINKFSTTNNIDIPQYTECVFAQDSIESRDISLCN